MLKFLLVDQFEIIGTGIGQLLNQNFPKAVFHSVRSLEELVGQIKKEKEFDMIILGDNVRNTKPEMMINQILEQKASRQILVFSDILDCHQGFHYYEIGANGYLSKESNEEEIIRAINALLTKGKYFDPAMTNFILNKVLDTEVTKKHINVNKKEETDLTVREIEIVDMMMSGTNTKRIAELLGIKYSTASAHKRNIFKKFDVVNIVDLIEKHRHYKANSLEKK